MKDEGIKITKIHWRNVFHLQDLFGSGRGPKPQPPLKVAKVGTKNFFCGEGIFGDEDISHVDQVWTL